MTDQMLALGQREISQPAMNRQPGMNRQPAMNRAGLTRTRRLKRQAAALAARCAMGSWIVLAAMPVAVVICALA